jgi:hypothetical protein
MSKKLMYLFSVVLAVGLFCGAASADPFQQDTGPDGIVSIEAENFDENVPKSPHTWIFVTEPEDFSGTGAMQSTPTDPGGGAGNDTGYVENSPRLDFEVNFTKTGTHYIWIRGYGQDGNSDSCHAGINGEDVPSAYRFWSFTTSYTWLNVTDSDPPRRTIDVPSAGVHTVNVWMREDACIVDKVVLTTNPDYTPTGEGPEESHRGPRLKAYHPSPDDGELYMDTWASLSWSPGETAVSHDVYFGENFADVNEGIPDSSWFQGNQVEKFYIVGFPGYPYPDGLIPGTTYYWRIDEVEADGATKHKGLVWSFTVPPKTAFLPDPADGAELVEPDVQLNWSGGFGSKFHYVYFGDNFDEVNNAAGGIPQGATAYTPGTLTLVKTYYWRVDEFDAVETHKGEVWSFTTEGAVGSPDPANGAVDVKQIPILSWTPGVYAVSHQVYFGNDQEAVRNADTGSPEYKVAGDLGAESYEPEKLEWNTTYYWRIDEANNVNPDSPWTGNVWSFTTANFLIVDDFEDYDAGENQIWYAWKDGLGYGTPGVEPYSPGNGTGSMVGDESTPSYTEETIVHGGNQSMPVFYDNSILRYSEVEKTLAYPRDWTENGVTTLSIWFTGDSANVAETLYVALNGNAVVFHDNPNAAQIETWTEWTIDLQAFADQGVNLSNVNTIAIGLGNKNNPVAGGSGTMYFDDIRLYPPTTEPQAP